jgi:hypothetical protein
LFLRIRLMELTEGTLYLSQTPSDNSLSRISQAKMPGSFCLRFLMYATTLGVVTRGLLPPIAPGKMEPVSWYRARILDTHPCETRSCLDMSQGLIPRCASSTMRWRTAFGRGRPFTNTPPSWLTSPYCWHCASAKQQNVLRCEVLTDVKMFMAVLQVVMPYAIVDVYQSFGEAYCLNFLQIHTAS